MRETDYHDVRCTADLCPLTVLFIELGNVLVSNVHKYKIPQNISIYHTLEVFWSVMKHNIMLVIGLTYLCSMSLS